MANFPSTWKELQTIEQLENALEDSHEKPVVLFKYSVHCSTSMMIKSNLIRDWDVDPNDVDFYYIDLINHRDVSTTIETKLKVQHESPQIIVVKNKKATHRSAHWDISINTIKKAIA